MHLPRPGISPRALAGPVALALLVSACGPAAAPSAAPALAKASPAGGSEAEWNQVVATAKREGVVRVAGPPGDSFRTAALAFSSAHPEIAVEYTGAPGREWGPRILAERRAGGNLWDVFIGGTNTGAVLKSEGLFDPIQPALRPDILDDTKWLNGFADGLMDVERRYMYAFTGFLNVNVVVNRKAVPESELSSVEQLVDPRWNGKISWNDPRVPGAGSFVASYWLMLKGEDWLRQLYQQDIVLNSDLRQQIEWAVLGRYPIAIGPDKIFITEFSRLGFETELTWLAPDSELGSLLTPGFGAVALMNGAAHPNAAKVYVNWLLSREGQESWARLSAQDSRRLDVPVPPGIAPKQGVNYVQIGKEENLHFHTRSQELARSIFR
jgi:iron(III) transport system substrate-binding protein